MNGFTLTTFFTAVCNISSTSSRQRNKVLYCESIVATFLGLYSINHAQELARWVNL